MSQPGIVTTGLVGEYHAARAHLGTTHAQATGTAWYNTGTGGSLNGTLYNFTGTYWVGSDSGTDPFALDFSAGTDRYVSCGDYSAVEDKVCTYEAWVKSSVSNATQVIFGESAGTTQCQLRASSTGLLASAMTPDGGSSTTTSGPSICDGSWHHVALVLGGTNRTLYADGALGTPAAIPAGTYTVSASRIGWTSSSWQGRIACVRVYSTALSLAELQQNRAAGYLWPRSGGLKASPVTFSNPVNLAQGVVYGTHS